ncbi:TetR/AcrR family transcriptional regulator [Sphingobium herbicidovorans]|uniref:TetR/AcrR family transcriptional regulator n=1 Tax=Sphingobium herbicidovorans TaxID=76947 RepID=UPI0005630E3D|nr:TetR/AcrR family transcriptional regulator [Sphingobium herbicidovorans]
MSNLCAEKRLLPANSRAAYLLRRRSATRAAILLAARDVFAHANYPDARVEDIFRQAGVSRATFYMHFASKLELAFAIYDEIAPQSAALFASLPRAAQHGLGGVEAWLRRFVAFHVEHRYATPLIAQLQLFEKEFRGRILEDTEALINALGDGGCESFRRAQGQSEAAAQQRVRARLLLNRIAAACAAMARGEISATETPLYLDLLARELVQFIKD